MARTRRTALAPHVAELLSSTDAFLASRDVTWWTLDPSAKPVGRGRARTPARAPSLVELGERILPGTPSLPALHEQQEIAWAMALSDLGRAIAMQFPENLFADLAFVGMTLRRVVTEHGHVALERAIDPIVRVHRLYGRRSRIRFRYVHDFLYGFDWARWVAKQPAERGAVGPFDAAFIAHSEQRAHELEQLIEAGDAKYPPLADGVFRNPFEFDRDPPSERALLTALAADGHVPVRAWELDARPAWDARFVALRVAKAKELGLSPA